MDKKKKPNPMLTKDYTPREKDERFKSYGSDQYGRRKFKMSGVDAAFYNPSKYSATKGFYFPGDVPLSMFGETTIDNGPLSEDEKMSRRKMNADAMEKGKYMKLAQMKAKKKSKPSAPKPSAPKPSAPKPSKPNYKDLPMPGKPDYKKKYYGKA